MNKYREKLETWWWYNKRIVIACLIVALLIGYISAQISGNTEPDYTVALISTHYKSPEDTAKIQQLLYEHALDVNEDGEIQVYIRNYPITLDDSSPDAAFNNPEQNMAMTTDLMTSTSGLIITEEPELLQEKTEGILAEPWQELLPGLYIAARFDANEDYLSLLDRLF